MMRVTPLLILYFAYLLKFSSSASDIDINAPANNNITEEDPLILTPLIEQGKIDEARRQALVDHEEMQNVESYSGYLTVNKTYNSNMFFWYFPAQQNPGDAPILMYLSGGPGDSSIMGTFFSGPLILTQNFTVKTRVHSWHTHHNMIYVDSPIGTGYSFTDDDAAFVRNQTEVGRDLLLVLLQFFQLFPELRKNDFYIVGDAYGSKFGCSVSRAIKEHNDAGETNINLTGMVLLAPTLDPLNQGLYSEFWYEVGLVDANERDEVKKMEIEVQELIKQEKYEEAVMASDRIAVNMYSNVATLLQNYTGYSAGEFNFNYLQDEIPADIARVNTFAASAGMREALHVGNVSYAGAQTKVKFYLKSDIMRSIVSVFADLLRHYRVLMFYGQVDPIVPYARTKEMLSNSDWPGVEEFRKAERKKWRLDGLAGYVTSAGNLTEVMVRKAGHMIAFDQTFWVWDMLNRFTRGDTINDP